MDTIIPGPWSDPPAVPASNDNREPVTVYGEATAEFLLFAARLRSLLAAGDDIMRFTVGDDSAAPEYRRGDLAFVDTRAELFDGSYFLFDWNRLGGPALRSWTGEPLKVYPTILRVQLLVCGGVKLYGAAGEPEETSRQDARRALIGHVVGKVGFHHYNPPATCTAGVVVGRAV